MDTTNEASLATEDGVRAFINESVFAYCADIMEKAGGIMPMAHVICRIHPETKKRMDKPGIVTMFCPDMSNESSKDAWTSAIRNVASKLSACGVILINEAWMLMAEKDADLTKITRPSESPNRVEVVMVVLEHIAAGKEMWMANIIREENNPPHLSEFKRTFSSKEEHTGYTGRFTGLIPETNPSVN